MKRLTEDQQRHLDEQLIELCRHHQPLSLRNLFYLAVSADLVPKIHNGYKQVGRRMKTLRLNGLVPWSWIVDDTRRIVEPPTWSSVGGILDTVAHQYRTSAWNHTDEQVMVMCESGSISGVLRGATEPLAVPLVPFRGHGSLTFQHDVCERIERDGRPLVAFYVGDHDPSGLDIERDIVDKLELFIPGHPVTVERIAVTPEQIELWNLPGKPPKGSDSRSVGFEGNAVEVESIEPTRLRAMAHNAILTHIPDGLLEEIESETMNGRARLRELAAENR